MSHSKWMEALEKIGMKLNRRYMPELPEVETIKNVLKGVVINKTISTVEVLREATIISGAKEFADALKNQTFLDVTRIGKFLVFHLSNDIVFLSHLRMEGKYYQFDEKDPNTKHTRVVFHFTDETKLIYDDSRCFGIMKLTNESNYKNEKEIASLGKEPFDIDEEYLKVIIRRCKKSSNPIKSTLLDQTLIAGLGNIYVDEVLYRSGIYPLRPSKDVTLKEWKTLIENAVIILKEAIKMGGSTIRSYHPGKDIDGNFQTVLNVYGKKDERCPKCGSHFHFTFVNGRGTTYCPTCQNMKKDKIVIGVTGKVASGKSSVIKLIQDKNIPVISSDEIVKDLYKSNVSLKEMIEKRLNLHFEKEVDKSLLREHLLSNPKDKKILESIVHPFVKEELESFINAHSKGLIAIEVPLLYESKMDKLCDFVIAIDIDETKQLERLKKRNIMSANELRIINSTNKFESYKDKVDYLIDNSDTLDSLDKQVTKVINKLRYHLN